MERGKVSLLVLVFVVAPAAWCLQLKNGAYEDFVVEITEAVPVRDCRIVLDNLEETLTSASQYLFSALDSRAFLRSATVLLPPTWPDSCAASPVVSGAGEAPDVTVLPRGPVRGRIFTQQSLGCGQPGDQIYLAYESLMQRDSTVARSLVKEFVMYRYGVFEEEGYRNDPIYPVCFYDDQTKQVKPTGCSDLPIKDNGVCSSTAPYNTTLLVDDRARSSIMFAAEAPQVSMFCDDGNHDRFAPTKHNSICQRRSVLDVIIKHPDFVAGAGINNVNSNQLIDTSIRITYKKQNLTRYVFVLENTKDMMQRESWSYLRLALRYWAMNILPDNVELGLVLAEESSKIVLDVASVKTASTREEISTRDKFYSKIPYTPSELVQPGCIACAVKSAVEMLNTRNKTHGPANSVVVVIAPGMENDEQINKTLDKAIKSKIKIATINYPTIMRTLLLNSLAESTKGVAYTVFERKLNVDTTLLSTYFELKNVLNDIVQRFYSGSQSDLPVEIHRREITDDGRTSITGSFMLDATMGKPSQFTFFTHNSVTPLIKSLKLISPSHQVFSERNDRYIDFKMIGLTANISEIGTWQYVVEPYLGNPQPHFLQVTATPISATTPVVRARFWTHRNEEHAPLILLVEVKKGEVPVLGAKVEVTVTKPEVNGSYPHKNGFELLDTGSGDPDITKGDGVYTRYFSAGATGPGLYTFEVMVTDNGNTAYTWTDSAKTDDDNRPCCGSMISSPGVTPISPFQRVLPKVTMTITAEDVGAEGEASVGRIGDLKAQIIPEDMKARFIWTSPDMGGLTVSRYEIKYASSVQDITDGFETKAKVWDNGQPFPLAPGSETTFTIDMSQNKDLLDKPLYFAIKAFPKFSSDVGGPASNWIRVLVPSPPPPPTVPPTYTSNEHTFWPNNANSVGVDPISPSISKAMGVGLEWILPIAVGCIVLVVILIAYCYFCVLKRRDHRDSHKKTSDSIKSDKLASTITIVPSSPQNSPQNQNTYTCVDLPDPHQIGVPVNYDYEEDTKKRYSLVNQQEQQLIEELKQQQQMVHQRELGTPNNAYQGLSVISTRNGHTLSPYNSWSASQLLHEHERRHSPMENLDEQMSPHQELLINAQVDHMSLNGQSVDHMSLNGHYPNQHHVPPPVPPLPAFNGNGYPVNYNIYGVHQGQQGHPIYQSMQRNETLVPFNPSLQGSLSSVNSGDKKRRNVTMV